LWPANSKPGPPLNVAIVNMLCALRDTDPKDIEESWVSFAKVDAIGADRPSSAPVGNAPVTQRLALY
jgi:hypothetical protein